MILKRLIYIAYYIKQTDYLKLQRFLRYAAAECKRPRVALFSDMLYSSLKYNIAFLDYFYFRFYNLTNAERQRWAGTGYLYEYQLRMNPKGDREVLENKLAFLEYFRQYVKRQFVSIKQLETNELLVQTLLANPSGKLVLKGSHGQVGAEVEVIHCKDYDGRALIEKMRNGQYDLIEEYVVQHPGLMALSPSGLNTVRIFTQLYDGKVDILGARLRISVNSAVDNMAAGNLAAPIDAETGMVTGPGVYSDIIKQDQAVHPVTGKAIVGFQVPFWNETIRMIEAAALSCPQNQSVGWDIAITPSGPELIEGNHNWCKLLWQLPVKKGLKEMLYKYYPVS